MSEKLAQGPMQFEWWRIQAMSDLRGCTQPSCSMGWNNGTQKPVGAGGRAVDGIHHSQSLVGHLWLILALFPREDSLEIGTIDGGVSTEL